MVREDLKAIERIARNTVPINEWQKIHLLAVAVETYLEFNALYTIDGDEFIDFDIYDLDYVNEDLDNNDVADFIQKLRDDIYKNNPDRGTFYSIKIEISKDSDPTLLVDYDSKPLFEGNVPDEWFKKDLKLYPRNKVFIPEWLKKI